MSVVLTPVRSMRVWFGWGSDRYCLKKRKAESFKLLAFVCYTNSYFRLFCKPNINMLLGVSQESVWTYLLSVAYIKTHPCQFVNPWLKRVWSTLSHAFFFFTTKYIVSMFLAGTKFFVVCEPGTQNMEMLLKYVYELYTDYVLKNPFYEMEMPIRCELFDLNVTQGVQKDRVALLGRWLTFIAQDKTAIFVNCFFWTFLLLCFKTLAIFCTSWELVFVLLMFSYKKMHYFEDVCDCLVPLCLLIENL